MGTDYTGSCKSNYHVFKTTTVPKNFLITHWHLYSLTNSNLIYTQAIYGQNLSQVGKAIFLVKNLKRYTLEDATMFSLAN
jgi:hypothetical protein